MQAKKEVQRLRLVAQAELRSEKLMEQLIIEDKTYKRGVKEAKKKRDQKDEFQRQAGRSERPDVAARWATMRKRRRFRRGPSERHRSSSGPRQFIRQMTIGGLDAGSTCGMAVIVIPADPYLVVRDGRRCGNQVERLHRIGGARLNQRMDI